MKLSNIAGSALTAACLLSAAPISAQELQALTHQGRTIHITRPGSYRLSHNVRVGQDAPAIVVHASGVSLDLAGHALIGPGGKKGVGVQVEGSQQVSVRNGTIQGFGFGVEVRDSVNVKLSGLQIGGGDLGGPPPGEVGIMIVNSRGVEAMRNVITNVFLGVFVRGGGSGANRIAENTLAGGPNGQLAICYNPDGLGTPEGPSGDLVYNNLISHFNVGIQTSLQSAGNIFRENDIAYRVQAIQELSPAGANLFEGNSRIELD